MWAAADKLRGHMDASEYKHVALGLIFLKYIQELRKCPEQQTLTRCYRVNWVGWPPCERSPEAEQVRYGAGNQFRRS